MICHPYRFPQWFFTVSCRNTLWPAWAYFMWNPQKHRLYLHISITCTFITLSTLFITLQIVIYSFHKLNSQHACKQMPWTNHSSHFVLAAGNCLVPETGQCVIGFSDCTATAEPGFFTGQICLLMPNWVKSSQPSDKVTNVLRMKTWFCHHINRVSVSK